MTHQCHYCKDTLKEGPLYPVEVGTRAFPIPHDPFDLHTFNRQIGVYYGPSAGRYKHCLACHTCIKTLQSRHVEIRQTAGPVKDEPGAP